MILREGELKNAFRLRRVGRAGNIVERAGGESSDVSAPIGQMRKDDDRRASGGSRQNADRGAEIAIRQIVAAKHKLKRLVSDECARVGQGNAVDGLQPEAMSDFAGLLSLKGIGRYDQYLAGVDHFSPPSDRISLARESRRDLAEIILSTGPVTTSSGSVRGK